MRKFLVTVFILALFLFPMSVSAQSQNPLPSTEQTQQPTVFYLRAKIVDVKKEYVQTVNEFPNKFQTLVLEIQDGKEKGKFVQIEHNNDLNPSLKDRLLVGQSIVMQEEMGPDNKPHFMITDMYRLNTIAFVFAAFVLITVLLTGKKGFGALAGLGISLAVILGFIVPQILQGHDPLTISIVGALMILFVTTYLAHGVSKGTTIAVASTFISLIVTYFLAQVFVQITHLAGLGTEDSYMLGMTPNMHINPQGLLLGGIIISTLGALNDVTVTQVSTIFALVRENPKQSFNRLYITGFAIGKQHILSLVNTLVLAYAGASLPIFVFLVLNPQHLPYWTILNSESLSEEIVRSIVGSMGLILAVPIATILASYLALQGVTDKEKPDEHRH
ncbi:hypothetical protein BH11PAT1_BH11PAT1_4680 [soil metagenome]